MPEPDRPTPTDLAAVADGILDDLFARRPEWATELGDHRFDDRLTDYGPGAQADLVRALARHQAALDRVDLAGLDPEAAVDWAMLADLLAAREFEATALREHEWNPLVHLPGHALHGLLARPFAPAPDRLRLLAGRLRALPDALATARRVLGPMPQVHVETAVGQADGLAGLIGADVAAALAGEPSLRPLVEPAQEAALRAVEEFTGWLRDRLPGIQAGSGADAGSGDDGHLDDDPCGPRLGERLWARRLGHALASDLTSAEVVAAARERVDWLTEEITAVAAEFLGEPAGPGVVRRALDRVASDAPTDATVVADIHAALADVNAFLATTDLVSPTEAPLDVVVMPEFARGVSVAYCDPPGPLETASLPTFYAIAPTPTGWPEERRQSFYREYNRASLRNLTVHEAVPGHHLQLAASGRFRGPTRVRAAAWSGTFTEGWAVYAEQFMAEAGFGGLSVRLQQLKVQLRMTINALLDHGVHCEGMSRAEAMSLMTDRGLQEEGEAFGKWRRALLTSGQLSTYFVGWKELTELRQSLSPAPSALRAFHDELLAHGSPPPRHLRALLPGPASFG
ncbi:DUF885 domain-containing protein [Frankia sp. AgB1.9]|uniref:DUF885 domain-containing protein n=1 Tax=unclassified Frankia TaxID=2632575 RepID=UPI00193379A7|nr:MULTISPECIES: DUF885 domain-containing protein [unclassified Frankia]MBL7493096.1 DUF885 domain-containing protein [Frankia sp. AgW1.1]MBL7552005.1 DUF885 domain-containing protein [Frankia sp. AgB1.9]MBL7618043.1 DUF885 domain-containing protein [Frankia sp. AgB1.8]